MRIRTVVLKSLFVVIDIEFNNCLNNCRVVPNAAERVKRTVQIDSSTVEIEERGVKLR